VILVAALLMLVQAEPVAGSEPPELNCDDPQAQLELNMCAWRDFETADAALNAQWAETSARMKALDEDIDRANDNQPGHLETLLEGQRAWLGFRDAQCRSESFMARGGSMQPMLVAQCLAYMTELRTEQLRVLAAGPEGN
jgi:uncharacterized protein YecT (DUF1311 family)